MDFLSTDFLRTNELFLRLDHTCDADPAKNWLAAYYFDICLPDGTKVGTCDLRIGHNDSVWYGGNIGYGVDEPYRGHHYAGKACKLLFELARRHDLGYVIITCRHDNVASAKTCEYVGGRYEGTFDLPEDNDMYREGMRQVRIYRIDL